MPPRYVGDLDIDIFQVQFRQVSSTPPQDGDVLRWDAATQLWVPTPMGAGPGPTGPTGPTNGGTGPTGPTNGGTGPTGPTAGPTGASSPIIHIGPFAGGFPSLPVAGLEHGTMFVGNNTNNVRWVDTRAAPFWNSVMAGS